MSEQDPAARDRAAGLQPPRLPCRRSPGRRPGRAGQGNPGRRRVAERDLRVYTSQEILDSWERFQTERSLAQRVAGAVTDDPETIEQFFGYARQGRAALWVHVPDDAHAKRAVRALADHQVLHFRHYGHGSQQDLHMG